MTRSSPQALIRRTLLARLALAVVVLVAEFAVFEMVLRAWDGLEAGSTFQSLFLQDPRLGYRLQPGTRVRYTTSEFTTDLAVNNQGVRDDVEWGAKAPDERRILVLGDSLVMSVQVDLQETFCKRLEADLGSRYPEQRWRVINGGVQGYGPVEEALYFRHVGQAFEPDLVLVVSFAGNDAIEAYDKRTWLDAGPPPSTQAPAATVARRLTRRSVVLQMARLRVDQFVASFETPGLQRPLLAYVSDPPPLVNEGLGVLQQAYRDIMQRAAAGGVRTAFVLMPARFQVNDTDFGWLRDDARQKGYVLDRQAGSERLARAVASLGAPTVDLLPILAAQPDPRTLFFEGNLHLTPRGHQVVADALASFLASAGLLASSGS